MEISTAWVKFVNRMSNLDSEATRKVGEFITNFKGFSFENPDHMRQLILYSYGISTKYGEAAAALACEMYDAIGLASGLFLDPAEPAEIAAISDVAKSINAIAKSKNVEMVSASVGRLVKLAGADTTLKNGLRDGAEFAWIPSGDTCAYCIALASRGWQKASPKLVRNGHAEHIHSNCNCNFAIRFNETTKYKGYDPGKYDDMYYGADLKPGQRATGKNRINALRREQYQLNKDEINAQKRAAYAKRMELQSSEES